MKLATGGVASQGLLAQLAVGDWPALITLCIYP
jgi:hypothetical protein